MGMTFTQNKKLSNPVSTEKSSNYQLPFLEKTYKKSSISSNLDNRPQIGISGTNHTVTTNKSKNVHWNLVSNPIPFRNAATSRKRIITKTATATHRLSSSKTAVQTTTCKYRRKKPPLSENTENGAHWLKGKEQPRNENLQAPSKRQTNQRTST